MDIRKSRIRLVYILCLSCLICAGCSVKKMGGDKLSDIDFTVVEEEDIPRELKSRMEESRKDPFRLTYGDQGYLYIARGYGRQKTSGYSIVVKEVYEAENAVRICTELIGPSRDEKIIQKADYPYIVVKIEYLEKQVVFE